jgi:hypothetical protein
MSTEIQTINQAENLERVLMAGDLAQLSSKERIKYYRDVCESLNLNPLTRPFEYITLNKKLTLYVKKDATEQLRKVHGISIKKIECRTENDVYIVTAYAETKEGRTDTATGAVSIKGLYGENLANAYMKAETKAKRRVTLSIVGLGWLDESEIDSIEGAKKIKEDEIYEGEIDRKEIEQKSTQNFISSINKINSLEELKQIFSDHWKTNKDGAIRQDLKSLYENKKSQLENQVLQIQENKEWVKEYETPSQNNKEVQNAN